MLLPPFGGLWHTSILYYCIKRMYFLEYNDFQKMVLNIDQQQTLNRHSRVRGRVKN